MESVHFITLETLMKTFGKGDKYESDVFLKQLNSTKALVDGMSAKDGHVAYVL
jgi:hypothetical protein